MKRTPQADIYLLIASKRYRSTLQNLCSCLSTPLLPERSSKVLYKTAHRAQPEAPPTAPTLPSPHLALPVMDSPRGPQYNIAPFNRPTLYRPAPSSYQSSPISSTSSTYQSSSSLSSLSLPPAMSPAPAPAPPHTTAAHSRQTSAAPLPSPTAQAAGATQYFGSLNPQMPAQAQRPQGQRQQSYEYRPDRTGAGTTAQETANLLNYNALVAEAAKRAQMAVLMRDMGEMEM